MANHILMERVGCIGDSQNSSRVGSLKVVLVHDRINSTPIVCDGLHQIDYEGQNVYHKFKDRCILGLIILNWDVAAF
jgi:hypothetical protein